jgi:hypothetical protein
MDKAEILEKFERAKEKWRCDSYNRRLRFHAPRPVYHVMRDGSIQTYLKVHRDYYLSLSTEAIYTLLDHGMKVLVTENPEQARQASIERLSTYSKEQKESLRRYIAKVEQQQAELETMSEDGR